MLCQNCGKREANIKYTQIINGVKKEMSLCENCAKELGVEDIHFNMPISFSSFLSDFLEPYESESNFMTNFMAPQTLLCENCKSTYDDFLKEGKFGCEECYEDFSSKIDPLLKNIHGSNRHVGRVSRVLNEKTEAINKAKEITKQEDKKMSEEEEKLQSLKKRLEQEIKEERYEDAAKTRDEIKRIENSEKGGK